MLNDFLNKVFLGNTVESYLWFAGILLAGLIFKKYLSKWFTRSLFKAIGKYFKGVGVDKLHDLLEKPFSLFVMLITIYFAFDRLEFPQHWELVPRDTFGLRMILFRLFQVGIVVSITWISLRIVDFLGLEMMDRAAKTESKSDDQLVPFAKESLKIIIAIFSVFFILGSVFKVNIASLVAGLGIGGLAVALAAKESLENLLGSFTIFLDKPFVIGDFITINNITGVVEKIGFRSTRIRTLEKSYVTVPNKVMVEASLDNLSLRTFRRGYFTIGVTYSTTSAQINAIVDELQKFLDDHPHTNQDGRVRFYEFGGSSLNIMVLYYVDTMEWDVYLNVRQEINYRIMEIVEKHGSGFAFPSTSIYIEEDKTKVQ